MSRRKLGAAEAQGLGLSAGTAEMPEGARRKLAPEEAASLGLSADPGAAATFITKAAQVPAYGFVDELAGAVGATGKAVGDIPSRLRGEQATPLGQAWNQDYESILHGAREQEKAGATAHPVAAGLGTAAGVGLMALAPVPKVVAPFNAAGAGGAARAAAAAANGLIGGGLAGLGNSEAPLLSGQAALDTAIGAGAGAGVGAVASGLGTGARALAGAAGRATTRAEQALANHVAEPIERELQVARGALGGEQQAGNRFVENLDRLKPSMTPQQLKALAKLEAQGILPDLRARLANANLQDVVAQSPVIAARRAALSNLLANEDAAKDAALAAAKASGWRGALAAGKAAGGEVAAKGAKETAGRVIGGALGAVLGMGGPFGVVGGALTGAAGQHVGAAVARSLSTPQGKYALAAFVESALKAPAALGKYAGPLAAAASRSPDAIAALHVSLAHQDPEYLPTLQRAALQVATAPTMER